MKEALLVIAIAMVTTAIVASASFSQCTTCGFAGSSTGWNAAACAVCPSAPVTVAQACPPPCPAPVTVAQACPPPCPTPAAVCPPTGVWKWQANLTGAPLGVGTAASGYTDFQLNKEGTAVRYWLHVNCVNNVTAAHVRMLSEGCDPKSAPIVATLFGGPVRCGTSSGRLMRGNIDACDLTGPLQGQPVSALTYALSCGRAVVTVETQQCPSGEIAGGVVTTQAPC